jgi:hypothetical protein
MDRPKSSARSWWPAKGAVALVAAMIASGLYGATGAAAGTLLGSSSAPAAGESSIAAAPAPVVVNASPASTRAKVVAPAKPAYESIFTPLTALPAQVKAPSVKQAAAFAALNALLSAQTRFSEDVIGMSVSLQRAQAASAAGAQLWYLRQTNASAEYAGFAAGVVSTFPALQTTMARAFVADKMSLTLSPTQVAAAKAKLRHGTPAAFAQVLKVAAAPYQHSSAPEAVALRAAILGATPTLQGELAHLPSETLMLPAVFASTSITTPEVRLARALRNYANVILQPVPVASPTPVAERPEIGAGFVLDGESQGEATEALEKLHDALEGLSALAKQFGGEAGEGAAETSFEPLGEAVGYAFAASVFIEAGDALSVGGEAGEGGGEAGGNGASAGSYGDPHQMTFSGAEYDFQAGGEFTLVKSTTDDLEVQGRQEPFPGAGSIAVDTATAMRVDGNVVELAANRSDNLQLWVNHQSVAYASRSLAGGGKISVIDDGAATVTWPDGTEVSVFSMRTAAARGRVTCNTSKAINVSVTVPPARSGHLEGLLGDPGAPPDELLGGNGAKYNMNELTEPWASAHNFDLLYHQFAPSWRVSQQSSLFYYPKGTSTATFTDLKAPSKALTVQSMAPKTAVAAEKDCKAAGITNPYLLNECIYDVGLSKSRGACFAAADAHVQATIGGPSAKGLPDSSGSLPAPGSTPTTTTGPQGTTTSTRPPGPTAGAAGVSDLSVSLIPDVAGVSGAAYTIDFRTSKTGALAADGGTITVTAAPGTKLPNCALVTDLSAGTDPVNLCAGGVAPAATMTLTAASTIGPGDRVEMIFTGATNPPQVGDHTLKVSTSKDSAGSAVYKLVPRGGAISAVSVLVTPKVAGASGATYTIDFRTSKTGALAADGGTMTVTAAPGTKLPNCALVTDLSAGTDPANLCDGGVAPAATMTLTAASTIGPGDRVQMVFEGATNASPAGSYTLRVSTSADAGGGARYDLVSPTRG